MQRRIIAKCTLLSSVSLSARGIRSDPTDVAVTRQEKEVLSDAAEIKQKIITVMRERVQEAQSQASRLIEQQWREEFNLPAGFVLMCVVVWYWISWTWRSVNRKCAAIEAAAEKEAREAVQLVQKVSTQWKTDMLKASTEMKLIIGKNSELTGDMDRMTTALRNCKVAVK